jgi:hypothetical protein
VNLDFLVGVLLNDESLVHLAFGTHEDMLDSKISSSVLSFDCLIFIELELFLRDQDSPLLI